MFWRENFENSGQPIWSASPKIEVLTYSDASDMTFRELRAARLVLESMASQLEGKEVRHRKDNQGAERIMSVGSRNPELHKEAILIYKICRQHNIRLTAGWVSRDLNDAADSLSRLDDQDDYMLDPACFQSANDLWEPHIYKRSRKCFLTHCWGA